MHSTRHSYDSMVDVIVLFLQWQFMLPLFCVFAFWTLRNWPAEEKNAKSEGVQLVEFDVSLTKDGVAVLLHDETLDRTTNLTGRVRDYFYRDLRACNCASKFKFQKSDPYNDKIRHVPMPLLEEMVKWAVANEMKLLFDIKYADKALVDKLEFLFKEHNLYGIAIVCSFFPSVVYRIKSQDPMILTGITWCRWFTSYADLETKIPRSSSAIIHAIAMLFDVLYVWSIHSWLPAFLGVDMLLTERSEISETVNDPCEMLWIRNKLKIPFITDKPYLANLVADFEKNKDFDLLQLN